jgi:hypothetical protein
MELGDLSLHCFREKKAVEIDKNSVLVQEPELTENTPEDRIKVNPSPFSRPTFCCYPHYTDLQRACSSEKRKGGSGERQCTEGSRL